MNHVQLERERIKGNIFGMYSNTNDVIEKAPATTPASTSQAVPTVNTSEQAKPEGSA